MQLQSYFLEIEKKGWEIQLGKKKLSMVDLKKV